MQPQNHSKIWIVVDSLEGPALSSTIDNPHIQVVSKENLKSDASLRFQKGEKIIISTETVLDDVLQYLDDPEKKQLISTLKNKVSCRRMLASLFPRFFLSGNFNPRSRGAGAVFCHSMIKNLSQNQTSPSKESAGMFSMT